MGEGDAVTAECLVGAQPSATSVQWTLDGKLLEGKSSTMMVRSVKAASYVFQFALRSGSALCWSKA